MRLDGVEIKVTLEGEQTREAVRALSLPDIPPWQIYFCEDVTPGLSAGTPLLDLGVILRVRAKPDGTDDTTVKLRPCRLSQLTDDWLALEKGEADDGNEWEIKIEADWSGERRALAASLTADRAAGVAGNSGSGLRPIEKLFTPVQVAFLRDSAGVQVNLGTLTVLPPVSAMRWRAVEVAPRELGLRAERWTVDGLDFLELSVVSDLDGAGRKQAALAEYVESENLEADESRDSKTQRVLDHLVTRVRNPRGTTPPDAVGIST